MDDFDIPIFRKTYELYKTLHRYRLDIPKQDRYTVWQRCENTMLDLLEAILLASQTSRLEKLPTLSQASLKLNLLRVFIRLMKDTKSLDNKKYSVLQEIIDEIGRMLGGWIRSVRSR